MIGNTIFGAWPDVEYFKTLLIVILEYIVSEPVHRAQTCILLEVAPVYHLCHPISYVVDEREDVALVPGETDFEVRY